MPAVGAAASVSAIDIAGLTTGPSLEEPWKPILPRSAWPSELEKTRVHARLAEWRVILRGLRGRNVLRRLTREQFFVHNGRPLGNGCVGVPKGDITAEDFDLGTCPLRFIGDLVPSNACQRCIGMFVPWPRRS